LRNAESLPSPLHVPGEGQVSVGHPAMLGACSFHGNSLLESVLLSNRERASWKASEIVLFKATSTRWRGT
jgi:hypothetical protein